MGIFAVQQHLWLVFNGLFDVIDLAYIAKKLNW